MELITRNKIIIGVAILLIAMNMALIGTIGFRFLREPKPPVEEPFNPKKAKEFVAKQLNLTSAQQDRFEQLRKEHMQSSKILRKEIRQTYGQVADELGSSEPREHVLDSLTKQIGSLHERQQEITIDHFMKLREVCSPEQHAHLKKMLIRMLNHNPMMRDMPHDRFQKQRNRGNTEK
jgi:Spy/CpxP family protein refolding chaperone